MSQLLSGISHELFDKLYAPAETGVFWEVRDFPIPEYLDPDLFYKRTKSALEKRGYTGPVSIRLYVDDKTLPDELINKYEFAGIKIILVHEGVDDRDYKMLLDIFFWALEDEKFANLIVFAKYFEDAMVSHYISCFHVQGYNLFTPLADSGPDIESPLWLYESLFDEEAQKSQHFDKKEKTIAETAPSTSSQL